jgi:hypothetical protein
LSASTALEVGACVTFIVGTEKPVFGEMAEETVIVG